MSGNMAICICTTKGGLDPKNVVCPNPVRVTGSAIRAKEATDRHTTALPGDMFRKIRLYCA
jgi:hypothetical protein